MSNGSLGMRTEYNQSQRFKSVSTNLMRTHFLDQRHIVTPAKDIYNLIS